MSKTIKSNYYFPVQSAEREELTIPAFNKGIESENLDQSAELSAEDWNHKRRHAESIIERLKEQKALIEQSIGWAKDAARMADENCTTAQLKSAIIDKVRKVTYSNESHVAKMKINEVKKGGTGTQLIANVLGLLLDLREYDSFLAKEEEDFEAELPNGTEIYTTQRLELEDFEHPCWTDSSKFFDECRDAFVEEFEEKVLDLRVKGTELSVAFTLGGPNLYLKMDCQDGEWVEIEGRWGYDVFAVRTRMQNVADRYREIHSNS